MKKSEKSREKPIKTNKIIKKSNDNTKAHLKTLVLYLFKRRK